MENVIVEIAIPALGQSFDFMVPAQNGAPETIEELTRILTCLHPELQFDAPELYDLDQRLLLNAERSLALAGIHDGSKLILI